jgi:hypothetical protein
MTTLRVVIALNFLRSMKFLEAAIDVFGIMLKVAPHIAR